MATIEELKSRKYEGDLTVDVCNAVYDTIVKNKYKTVLICCQDQNLMEWLGDGHVKAKCFFVASAMEAPATKLDFVFWQGDTASADLEYLSKRIRTGGQMAFHGAYEAPLRAFFNHASNWENWQTIEIPLGDGLFIARRL